MINNKGYFIFLYLLFFNTLAFAQLKVDTTKNVDQIIKTFFSSSKDLLINNPLAYLTIVVSNLTLKKELLSPREMYVMQ